MKFMVRATGRGASRNQCPVQTFIRHLANLGEYLGEILDEFSAAVVQSCQESRQEKSGRPKIAKNFNEFLATQVKIHGESRLKNRRGKNLGSQKLADKPRRETSRGN